MQLMISLTSSSQLWYPGLVLFFWILRNFHEISMYFRASDLGIPKHLAKSPMIKKLQLSKDPLNNQYKAKATHHHFMMFTQFTLLIINKKHFKQSHISQIIFNKQLQLKFLTNKKQLPNIQYQKPPISPLFKQKKPLPSPNPTPNHLTTINPHHQPQPPPQPTQRTRRINGL